MNHRKNLRLTGYDYTQSGCYFVTICTREKRCILSDIHPGDEVSRAQVRLTRLGQIVAERIGEEAEGFGIHVLAAVVMPNHIHLLLESDGTKPLGQYVGAVKSRTAYYWRQEAPTVVTETLWQRGYYDHVIRNQQDLMEKWKYIDENPDKWVLGDRE